jgi:hypothetical protein
MKKIKKLPEYIRLEKTVILEGPRGILGKITSFGLPNEEEESSERRFVKLSRENITGRFIAGKSMKKSA